MAVTVSSITKYLSASTDDKKVMKCD